MGGPQPKAGTKGQTYKGQLGDHHAERGQEIDGKVGEVIVGIMRAEEEEADGDAEQELLGRGVLVPIVDLLPHVEIVVGTGVELEGDAPHPVEHEEGTEHVADVGERPRGLLGDTGDDVVEDLEGDDQDEVDGPGT